MLKSFIETIYYISLLKNKFNFFIVFYLLIKAIISEGVQGTLFTFKFAKVQELNNGGYILCSESKIFIYDSQFSQKSEFDVSPEITTRADFEFVTIAQYPNEDGGQIAVLYKNKIFLLSQSDSSILVQSDINIETSSSYYTLIPYKHVDDYNFIIGYITLQFKFTLQYFNFDITNNSTDSIITVNPNLPNFQGGDIQETCYNGFSCHIMISNDYGKVLTCFYERLDIFNVCSFNIGTFTVIDGLSSIFETSFQPVIVRSDIYEDQTKALICYLKNDGSSGHCLYYDINENTISSLTKYSDNCSRYPSSINVYYSKITKEFFFSCYSWSNTFTIVKFDENFNAMENDDSFSISSCDTEFVSILYNYQDNKYYFIISCGENIKAVKFNQLSDSFTPVERPTNNPGNTDNSEKTQTDNNISDKNSENIKSSTVISSEENKKYYYDEKKKQNIILEDNQPCPQEFFYENKKTKECIKTCDLSELLNNNCFINNITPENIEIITQQIRNTLKNTKINSETNIIIDGENAIYQIISSLNMNDNLNKNISIIDFGECETRLRKNQSIDYLLVLKIDTKIDSNSANILNYEVYNPNTLDKLDLSICEDIKINTYSHFFPPQETLDKIIKLNLSGYDLYNINDSFYQDLCSPFTTDNDTDILLSDRKYDYYENVSLCEKNCAYKKYDYTIKKIQCECPVKKEIKIEKDEIDKDSFFSSFIDVDNFSNIKVLKCFNLVFSKIGQKNNIGSYIFLMIIFIIIILGIIYRIYQIQNIIKIFRKIIKNDNTNQKTNKDSNNIKNYNKNENINNNINNTINNNINNIIKNINNNKASPPLKRKKKKNITIFKKPKNIKVKTINNIVLEKIDDKTQNNNIFSSSTLPYIQRIRNANNINSISLRSSLLSNNKKTINKKFNTVIESNNEDQNTDKKKKDTVENKYNYNDEELNYLKYNEAIIYDKRTYGKYYCSLIMKKQLILFTFCNDSDYNIFILKLALFLFSFSLYFTVNVVFFVDSTVHHIYEKKGQIDLLFQIPDILYSTIISSIIGILIKNLALSNNDMLKIKQIKNIDEALRQSALLVDKLIIKFNLFFILCSIFSIFFWYFISAFCAVFKNTQTILFENTLSSFALSLLYPFGLNILPGLLRIPSLRTKSKFSIFIYNFSKLLSYI